MIDEGLPEEWPGAVINGVLPFQQGDLVADPPFMYVGTSKYGVWALTRSFGETDEPEEIFELAPEDKFPFGMIASESCDVTEEDRRNRKHPWLHLAPVYAANDTVPVDTLELIKEGRYSYLRSVENSALGDGTWIVDARILIPIEKSWLVGRVPIRVYSTSIDLQSTADFFANRFRRVDIDPRLHDSLIKPLRRWLEHLSLTRFHEVFGNVKEVRLAISGDPLSPDGASLIIIVDDKANIEHVQGQWDPKWENWRERADKVGIALLMSAYETYDSLSARGYRESLPIDVSFN